MYYDTETMSLVCERCEDCICFSLKRIENAIPIGECRWAPPLMGAWPEVRGDQWCMAYEGREDFCADCFEEEDC